MIEKSEISIIIVSYNVRQYLLPCITSVIDTCRDMDHEIIVVDNASTDGSAEAVKEQFPQVKVIINQNNAGFAKANNQGYEISTGDYILLLNPDTVAKPGAIKTVLEFMRSTPAVGLAGCRMVDEDGNLQKTIKRMPSVTGNIIQALFLD
ncbi:MAG: glycosyltransferase family 2 protein, partial [bacterium]|nr:glycosyltransferase family 2 protein [bacterium]